MENAVREELRILLVQAAELETEEKVSAKALSELQELQNTLKEDRDRQLESIARFEAENGELRAEISRGETLLEEIRQRRQAWSCLPNTPM